MEIKERIDTTKPVVWIYRNRVRFWIPRWIPHRLYYAPTSFARRIQNFGSFQQCFSFCIILCPTGSLEAGAGFYQINSCHSGASLNMGFYNVLKKVEVGGFGPFVMRGVSFIWRSPNSKERANSGRSRCLVRVEGADSAFSFPLSDVCSSLRSTIFFLSLFFFSFWYSFFFFNWQLGVANTFDVYSSISSFCLKELDPFIFPPT